MKQQVDNSVQQQGWPPDKFHPVYDTWKDWLDGEAPEADTTVHHRPHYRRNRQ